VRLRPGTAQGRRIAAEALARGTQQVYTGDLAQERTKASQADVDLRRAREELNRKDEEIKRLQKALSEAIAQAQSVREEAPSWWRFTGES
jgi:uncharacterized protein HemX